MKMRTWRHVVLAGTALAAWGAGWAAPEELTLRYPGDAELAALKDRPALRALVVLHGKVTSAGLAGLKVLTGLESLGLTGMPLTDAEITGVVEIKSLRALDLTHTKVTGAGLKLLRALPELRELKLTGCSLTDADMTGLAELRRLRRLSLNHVKVTDVGLARLTELREMEELNLCSTGVTDAGLAHLKEMKALRSLDLGDTAVTGTGFDQLNGLKKLEALDLEGAKVGRQGVRKLKQWEGLRTLALGDTEITDSWMDDVKELRRLTTLDLCDTQVGDAGVAHCVEMPALAALRLSRNTRVTDAAAVHLKKMAALRCLRLNGTAITDAALAHLKDMKGLEYLDLWGTKITDAGLAHLKEMEALRELDLLEVPVTDAGLAHLKQMKALEALDLAETPVTDAGMEQVAEMRRLRLLDLRHTRVTDAGIARLTGLPIEQLVLQATQVTDAGLTQLKPMKTLRKLTLYGTRVTPEGVRDLVAALPELEALGPIAGQPPAKPLPPLSPPPQTPARPVAAAPPKTAALPHPPGPRNEALPALLKKAVDLTAAQSTRERDLYGEYVLALTAIAQIRTPEAARVLVEESGRKNRWGGRPALHALAHAGKPGLDALLALSGERTFTLTHSQDDLPVHPHFVGSGRAWETWDVIRTIDDPELAPEIGKLLQQRRFVEECLVVLRRLGVPGYEAIALEYWQKADTDLLGKVASPVTARAVALGYLLSVDRDKYLPLLREYLDLFDAEVARLVRERPAREANRTRTFIAGPGADAPDILFHLGGDAAGNASLVRFLDSRLWLEAPVTSSASRLRTPPAVTSVLALGLSHAPDAKAPLLKLLADPTPVDAFVLHPTTPGGSRVRRDHPDWAYVLPTPVDPFPMSAVAAIAMGELGDPAVVPDLEAAAQGADKNTQRACEAAVRQLRKKAPPKAE